MEGQQPKHPGVPVVVDGRTLIVPSLTVRQFKENEEILTQPLAEGEKFSEYMEKRLPVIGAAVRRNYPEISNEYLADAVDLANFRELVRAVQAASGMQQVKPGE